MKNRRLVLAFASICSLVIGLMFYLLFNNEALVTRIFYRFVSIRALEVDQHSLLNKMIRCYGADLLWAVAFTLAIQYILWLEKRKTYLLISCSLLGIIYELLQYSRVINGTADLYDVLVYFIGSILAILIIQGGELYEKK